VKANRLGTGFGAPDRAENKRCQRQPTIIVSAAETETDNFMLRNMLFMMAYWIRAPTQAT
jgi:hypothetical protein